MEYSYILIRIDTNSICETQTRLCGFLLYLGFTVVIKQTGAPACLNAFWYD